MSSIPPLEPYANVPFVNEHGSHARPEDDLHKEARFLLDRLFDYEHEFVVENEEGARQWYGHIQPSIQRLRRLLGDNR